MLDTLESTTLLDTALEVLPSSLVIIATLPVLISPFAFATVIYAWSLLNLAALDFLGLGGSPSVATWGRMLNEGRTFLAVAPWIALGPGVMLALSVIAVTGLSDAWRRSLPGSYGA